MSMKTRMENILGDMFSLAKLSKILTRTPPEVVPPTPFTVGPLTDDIDPETGKLYPDYLERRIVRAKARAETYVPKDLGNLYPGD